MKIVIVITNLFLIMFFCIFPIKSVVANSKAICTANKVNIRSSAKIANNIITQCNIGDQIEIIEDNNKIELGKPVDYFVKIRFNKILGWIHISFITNNFTFNKAENFVAWAHTKILIGAANPIDICIYNYNNKTLNKTEMNLSEILFSPSGKYFVTDLGSDKIGTLSIFELPSLNKLFTSKYDRKILVWDGESITFNKCTEIGGGKYKLEEYIFKDGKIISTGKKDIFEYIP